MISGAFTITWDLVVILNFSMDKYVYLDPIANRQVCVHGNARTRYFAN